MKVKKLTPIKKWIKDSLEIYFKKNNLIYLSKFALLQLLLLGMGSVVIIAYLGSSNLLLDLYNETVSPEQLLAILPLTIAAGLMYLFFYFLLNIATIKAVSQVLSGSKFDVRKNLTFSLKKFIPIFAADILVFLIIIFGLVLLIIPAVIFYIWLYFVKYIMVVEDVSPLTAIKKSRNLARGYFWALIIRSAVLFVLNLLASFAVGVLIFPLVKTAILTLITPYWMLLTFMLFEEIKKNKGSQKASTE